METKEREEENRDENTAEEENLYRNSHSSRWMTSSSFRTCRRYHHFRHITSHSPEKWRLRLFEHAMENERVLCIFRPKRDLSKDDIKNLKKSNLSPIGSLIHILRYKTDDEDVLFLAQMDENVFKLRKFYTQNLL